MWSDWVHFMKKSSLFVCNSFAYDRIQLNFFAEDVKYNYFTEYVHSNAEWHVCRVFFENMKFPLYPPGGIKFEKSMIFLAFLVLSPYCFLIVKSWVEHIFADFRVIWWRKSSIFHDLETNSFVWKNLHFVVCTFFTYHRVAFNLFCTDVKYNYFTEYLHFNA